MKPTKKRKPLKYWGNVYECRGGGYELGFLWESRLEAMQNKDEDETWDMSRFLRTSCFKEVLPRRKK